MQCFYVPTRVCTGRASVSQLGELTRQFGERALWVCGPGALRRAGILTRGLELLSKAQVRCSLYDRVTGEPTLDMVKEALHTARTDRSQVVIGVGGGSAMDVAKAVAVLFSQPAPVEYYHRGEPINSKGLPCILVPTTAGTGTEVTNNAVLTDVQRGIKQSLRGTALFADVAIVDPELTVSLPPDVTASSGADALCQAIEAYVSSKAQPPTDALAGQAIRWIGRSLVRAYEQGADLQARSDMLYGSLLTGMCMPHTRLGGAHALAHPLGHRYRIPHGVVCGLLLPYVMDYSLQFAPEKYAQVADLLGLQVSDLQPEQAALVGSSAVRRILRAIQIPDGLSGLGVQPDGLSDIITEASGSGNAKSNPRPLAGEDLRAILESAL